MNILTSGEPPSLLFIAGHGMQFGKGDPRQEAASGPSCALIGSDLVIKEEMFLSASDVGSDLDISGAIVFAFVSSSAGTSRFDDFAISFPSETRREMPITT